MVGPTLHPRLTAKDPYSRKRPVRLGQSVTGLANQKQAIDFATDDRGGKIAKVCDAPQHQAHAAPSQQRLDTSDDRIDARPLEESPSSADQ